MSCVSETDYADRRARLYEAAYRAGLGQTEAKAWVTEQLSPRPKPAEATPTLFGGWMARSMLTSKRGGQSS